MSTVGAQPIKYDSPLGGDLLTNLLGRRQTGTTNSQQLTASQMAQQQQGSQTGTQSGSSSGTTTTSANIDPLMAVFNQGMTGMTPEALSALISSVFSEGAQGVPALIGAYANATGSRAGNNSGLQLALGDLNKQLSSSVVQQMLQYNQQGQQNAGNAASQIAANTRQTANTGTTAQTNAQTSNTNTAQTQTGAQTQNQQQRQTTTANPGSAALLGLGGTALNFLGKTPWGKSLLGGSGGAAGGAGGAVGTIGGGTPIGAADQTSIGQMFDPSYQSAMAPTSAGFLPSAVSVGGQSVGGAPMGSTPVSIGGAAPMVASAAPAAFPTFDFGMGLPDWATGGSNFWGGGGLTDYGMQGGAGVGLDFFGNNGVAVGNEFVSGGGGSLLDAGSSAGPISLGGTDYAAQFAADDAAAGAALAGGGGGFFDSVGGFFGDIWDSVGSWFANGGFVNPQMVNPGPAYAAKINSYRPGGYADGGLVSRTNASLDNPGSDPASFVPGGVARSTFNDLNLGMIVPGMAGFADGGRVGYAGGGGIGAVGDTRYGNVPARPAPMPPQATMFDRSRMMNEQAAGLPVTPPQPLPVDPQQGLMQFLLRQMLGFADGGQVQTGGNIRNRNQMGAPVRRQQQAAINYEGYAPAAGGVGASTPTSTTLANVAAAAPAGGIGGGAGQSAFIAPGAPQQQSQAVYVDPVVQAMQIEAQRTAQANAARAAIAEASARGGGAGGSGGVGEGAAPGQNEADNGQAGIGPSGIAAAPTGTGQAASLGLGQLGMVGIPGLSTALQLALISSIASQVNAGNQPGSSGGVAATPGAVSSPVSQSNVQGIDIGPVGGDVGADPGGVSTSSDAASGDGSAGSGAGSSGTSGTGDSPGDGWADGGLVSGAGTGTSDSIRVKSKQPGGKDIKYSDGEFVIPADVVSHFGAGTFQSIIDSFHTPA